MTSIIIIIIIIMKLVHTVHKQTDKQTSCSMYLSLSDVGMCCSTTHRLARSRRTRSRSSSAKALMQLSTRVVVC